MANGFTLDSEQLQQSPQQQQLAAQQPTPAQGQGGGLLGFLGNLGTGLAEGLQNVGAYYQAARGNPALLQQLQAQEQQKNLLTQLQSISKQEMEGPFGQTLQRQLQFGDVEGAQKTLLNLPKYKQAQDIFKNPKLGLDPAEQESLGLFASVDPDTALKLGAQLKVSRATGERRMQYLTKEEELKQAREARTELRKESKTVGAIMASAILSGALTADNAEKVLPGLLRRNNVKVPTKPEERQVFFQDLLSDPTFKLVPESKKSGIFERLFGGPKAPAATAPVAPQQPSAIKRFNPQTGLLE